MDTRLKKLAGILNEEDKLSTETIDDAVIKFFHNNPAPSETQIHALAKNMDLSSAALEERSFKLLGTLLKKIGKHQTSPDSDFDADQLAMGVKVEMEHTDHSAIAKLIAKDHLAEIKDYYTRLGTMEVAAGRPDAVVTSPEDEAAGAVEEDVIAVVTNFEDWWKKAQKLGAKFRARSADQKKFMAMDTGKRHSFGAWDRDKNQGELYGIRKVIKDKEIFQEDLNTTNIE